jgi:hypothetical protein
MVLENARSCWPWVVASWVVASWIVACGGAIRSHFHRA